MQYIDDYMGHGVFAGKSVKKNDYILQYQGEPISYKEGSQTEKLYREKPSSSFPVFLRYGKSCKSIVKAEKKKTARVPWLKKDKAAVERQPGQLIRTASLLGIAACEEAKRKMTILARRPWTQIKYFIKCLKYKPSMLKLKN